MIPPDPDIAPLIARQQAVYARWRRDTPIAQRRADWQALFAAPGPGTSRAEVIGGVPCLWVQAPGARQDKIIVYLHGGGFQLGSPRSHQELMGWLSAASGASVLGVAYRLAPEHRHPAALDDAVAVLQALFQRGIQAGSLALAGDSAGGGLALCALLRLQADGQPSPVAAYLMSAWTDLSLQGASYLTHADRDPLHGAAMLRATASLVLGPDGDTRSPYVSALFAAAHALRALPPVLLQVGEREVVLDDSVDMAARIRAAGGTATCEVWPGMFHVFQQFPDDLAQAREALGAGGRFLAAHLGLNGPPHEDSRT